MSTAVRQQRARKLHPSYLALVQVWPLRQIRTAADYEAAGKVLDRLVLNPAPDPGELDYLGALETLIEAYDEAHFTEISDDRPAHEKLKELMAQSGTSAADLQRILGVSQTLVSLMLNGKRQMSKQTIRLVSEHFRLNPWYFLSGMTGSMFSGPACGALSARIGADRTRPASGAAKRVRETARDNAV